MKGTPPTAEKVKQTSSFSAAESQAGGSSSSATPSYKGLGGGGQRNCVVKVVQAEKKLTSTGKLEFTCIDQMYIDVTPLTANIEYIQSELQAKWGTDYFVVSNDGLRIGDSAATRGKDTSIYSCKRC